MSYHGSWVSNESYVPLSLAFLLGLITLLATQSFLPTISESSADRPSPYASHQGPAQSPSALPAVGASTLRGIDVSQYQKTPSWGSVAGSGVVFAFARAVAYYGQNDPDFGYDMSNGHAAGVYMGAYDFVYPSYESASGDADYFNGVIKPYVSAGYMYPALDLEEDCVASGGSMSASQITAWVNAWATELQKDLASDGYPGVNPIIYMNSNYASNCITSAIGGWHVWIADYCGCGAPSTGIFGYWNYWQYTSSGSVNGISGSVDMDLFAGTLSNLQSGFLFGGAPLTASYSVQDTTSGSPLYCGGTFYTGDTIRFQGSASGGSGGYSYAWNFGDGTSGTGNPASHVYTKTGTIDAILTVTDSSGGSKQTGSGCPFTVSQGLAIASPLAVSPNPVIVGNVTTFSISASGGATPYSYSYSGLPPGCSSSSTNSLSCTPNTVGNYQITVTVTDAQGRKVTSTTSLVVRPTPLVIAAFLATPSSLMVNNSTTFTVRPSGGLPPYSFSFTSLPPGCVSANVASLTCAPNTIGWYTVSVQVNDSYGQTQRANTTIDVTPRPVVISAFTAMPSIVMIGNNTTLQVNFTGGLGPYSYSYEGLPAGCDTHSLRVLLCTPFQSGAFTVTVIVNDSQGRAAVATTNLTVQEGLTVSSFVATPALIKQGQSSTLTVDVTSGIAPYSYSYLQLPPGCKSTNTSSLVCTPTRAGTYHLIALVRDSMDRLGSSVLTLTVIAPITILSFSASPTLVTVDEQSILTVQTTGGSSPLKYTYTGLPTGCVSASVTTLACTPSGAGNFTVTITVTDSLGDQALSTVKITVEPAYLASHPASSPLFSPLALALVGLGVIVLVGLALWTRRRRQRAAEATKDNPAS